MEGNFYLRAVLLFQKLIVITAFFFFSNSYATTYCVDPDGVGGAGCEDVVQTIVDVNTLSLIPGDSVLFKRGEIWNELLIIPASGTIENPITFGAYGDPALDKPVFDGMTDVTVSPYSWNLASSISDENKKVWYLNTGYSSAFVWWFAVIEEGGVQELMLNRGGDLAAGQALENHEFARINYTPDKGSWTFYVRSDSGSPGVNGRKVYLSRNFATLIDTNGKDNLVIEDIVIRGAAAAHDAGAIFLNHSENVVLRNNEIYFSKIGIRSSHSTTYDTETSTCIQESLSNRDVIASTIEGNDIHDNIEGGIYLKGFSRDNIIRGNKIHDNYVLGQNIGDRLAIGITGNLNCAFQRPRNKIENNKIYNNGTYGVNADAAVAVYSAIETDVIANVIQDNNQNAFYFAQGSDNSRFSSNLVFGNQVVDGVHLYLQRGANMTIENNTIYGNTVVALTPNGSQGSHSLIRISQPASGNYIRNNIIVGNRMLTSTDYPAYLVWLQNVNNIVDHNLYFDNVSFDSSNLPTFLWAEGRPGYELGYDDLSAWKSEAQRELNSIEADPLFADVTNQDFHLSNKSLAINTGMDVGLTSDFEGHTIVGVPDIGAYENQDPDNDAFDAIDDCDSQNAYIYPGAEETKHDGIDQDCNGYDLTIDIILVQYLNSNKLKIWTTSNLRENAALVLDTFGSMNWNSTSQQWELVTDKVISMPSEVVVIGIEGEEKAIIMP